MSEARVKVSFVDGTIEIEGNESFVRAELETFRPSIRAGLAKHIAGDAAVVNEGAGDLSVDGIFKVADRGAIQIVPDIPGNNRAQKIVNAGKLLAYGAARLQNRRTVRFAEVRGVCKAHRCYDPGNLATTLKKQRTAFVFGGRNHQQTIALTESGVKDAETMIRVLAQPVLPAAQPRALV